MRETKILLTTLMFFFFIYSVVRVFWADILYVKSRSINSPELASQAIRMNRNEPRYYYGRARLLIQPEKNLALQDLKIAEGLNPKNLVTLRNIAPFYFILGANDEFLPVTIEYLEDLSNKYPNDVGVQVLVAKYERQLGLSALYVDKIEKIRVLRPDLLEWHPDLR